MGQPERQRHVGKPQVGQDQGKQQVEHHSLSPTSSYIFFSSKKREEKTSSYMHLPSSLALSTTNGWQSVSSLMEEELPMLIKSLAVMDRLS